VGMRRIRTRFRLAGGFWFRGDGSFLVDVRTRNRSPLY
jgi:hypothetical protein